MMITIEAGHVEHRGALAGDAEQTDSVRAHAAVYAGTLEGVLGAGVEAVAFDATFDAIPSSDTSEAFDEGGHAPGEITRRAADIGVIVQRYKDHPYVQHALFERRTKRTKPRVRSSDPFNAYLAEIDDYPLLSHDVSSALGADVSAGLALYQELPSLDNLTVQQTETLLRLTVAQQLLFLSNLRLVVFMSKQFRKAGTMDPMELIQEGNSGLAYGIAGYNPQKGLFNSYAGNWIWKRMTQAMASQTRTIRIPDHVHDDYLKAQRQVKTLRVELGREPTPEEIEDATGLSMAAYSRLISVGSDIVLSLNQPSNVDMEEEVGERIEDPRANLTSFVEALSAQVESKGLLARTNLTTREKLVLGLRYGLPADVLGPMTITLQGEKLSYQELCNRFEVNDGLTQKEIGAILGITGAAIGFNERTALTALKRQAADEGRIAAQ